MGFWWAGPCLSGTGRGTSNAHQSPQAKTSMVRWLQENWDERPKKSQFWCWWPTLLFLAAQTWCYKGQSREGKPAVQQTLWPSLVTSLWPATLQAGQRPQGTLPGPAQQWGHTAILSRVKQWQLNQHTFHLPPVNRTFTFCSDKCDTALPGAFSA